MRPAHLPQGTLVPAPDSLAARLHEVERKILHLEALNLDLLSDQEQRGVAAHLVALSRRRSWYLTRLRAKRPVQTLSVAVQEHVSTHEAL